MLTNEADLWEECHYCLEQILAGNSMLAANILEGLDVDQWRELAPIVRRVVEKLERLDGLNG